MPTHPIEDMTPRETVAELDRYIVGQTAAKRAVAVALRNRLRRQRLPEDQRADIMPKNILMIGPTGVGKTEIARRLAQLAQAPFIKVEATKFTEVGYVGRDVESIARELVAEAVRMVEREHLVAHLEAAAVAATERLVDLLDTEPEPWGSTWSEEDGDGFEAAEAARHERREGLRRQVEAGELDDRMVLLDLEDASNPFMKVFTPQGMEEMGLDLSGLGHPARRVTRRMSVAEARTQLIDQEAKAMMDTARLHREAIDRAEQTGIVFLDEIDKVAGHQGGPGTGPDVSREGVQRDLLPIIEGSTVATKYGNVRTDHVLFIAAGAFHMAKPSDLIPELQGRLPIRVELEALNQNDFGRILREPQNALTKQYQAMLGTDGVEVEFTDGGLDEVARLAFLVNERTENIGARRLATMLERLLEDVLFEAPYGEPRRVVMDEASVRAKLEPLVADLERSRAVL